MDVVSSQTDYPRVLSIGSCFTEFEGNGMFLARLFWGWPADRFATVTGRGNYPPNWRRCRRHYHLGDLEYRLTPPFNWLVPARFSGPVLPDSTTWSMSGAATAAPANGPLSRWERVRVRGHRLARFPWRAFLYLVGGGEILYDIGPSPQLLAWLREFQPEVIYALVTDLNSVRFMHRTQQALGLPFVLHFMDDFSGTLYRKGWTARCLRARYRSEFADVVRSAHTAIGICREMAEEYERRYRRPFTWLPVPAELDAYQAVVRTEWTAGRPFRLGFSGRLSTVVWDSVADIAEAVHALRQDGVDVVFDLRVFDPESVPPALRTASGVTVQPIVPLAELPRFQAQADALVVSVDFHEKALIEHRYSMPSKVAGCMASGTPILVYAPAGLPIAEYARRDRWGKLVDRRDPAALRAALRELIESAALREQLGRTARRLATEHHNASAVSRQMQRIMTAARDSAARPPRSAAGRE